VVSLRQSTDYVPDSLLMKPLTAQVVLRVG